jgi:hypothetical protein
MGSERGGFGVVKMVFVSTTVEVDRWVPAESLNQHVVNGAHAKNLDCIIHQYPFML